MPEEFVLEAIKRGHPGSLFDGLSAFMSMACAFEQAPGHPATGHPFSGNGFLEPKCWIQQKRCLPFNDLNSSGSTANASIRLREQPSFDEELRRKTCEEVCKGWLAPIDDEEAINKGRLSRRFAVVQSGKVRCVDNYNESQIHDTTTVMCKVTVDGADTVAAMMSETMRALREAEKFSAMLAGSFDLKSAYRQLAISDESLQWARICAFNPSSRKAECL